MARLRVMWKWFVLRRWRLFGLQHRLFMLVQIAIALFCVHYWRHLPAPGWAVAILAGVAAAMSVHGDMQGWQKAVWMSLIGVLLVIELRAISNDRRDADAKAQSTRDQQELAFKSVRDAQESDFKATAQGLSDSYALSQRQFDATMKQANKVLDKTHQAAHLASEGIAGMIGTDSYLEVIPQHSFPVTPQNKDSFLLMVVSFGEHIVWDGEISMAEGQLDESFYGRANESFKLKPISKSNMAGFGKTIQPSKEKVENWYAFSFTSRGTAGAENLDIRFNKDKGEWEYQEWLYAQVPSPANKLPNGPITIHYQPWTTIPTPILIGNPGSGHKK